jgi:hypothetical protein
MQMREIIILSGETAYASGKEEWYTDKYVAEQLQRLSAGERI